MKNTPLLINNILSFIQDRKVNTGINNINE